MLIDRTKSFLLVVDLQERLVPAISGVDKVVVNVEALIKAAGICNVPVYATEHCSDRIGHTIPQLDRLLDPGCVVQKTSFSALREPQMTERFRELERSQVIVTGTEAHVCVLQSAMGFQEAGFQVYLAADATSSRDPGNRDMAIERLRRSGVEVVTTEMIVFEWLERGDSDQFRELLPVIKTLS